LIEFIIALALFFVLFDGGAYLVGLAMGYNEFIGFIALSVFVGSFIGIFMYCLAMTSGEGYVASWKQTPIQMFVTVIWGVLCGVFAPTFYGKGKGVYEIKPVPMW